MSRAFAQLSMTMLATVLLVGCGEERPDTDGRMARLVVRESLPSTPRYTEGSLSFLRLEWAESGEVVVDGPMTGGREVRGRTPLLSRRLAPGDYHLISYQRPCQGNCRYLDPPTDRCDTILSLDPGEVLTATVELGADGGCTIRTS